MPAEQQAWLGRVLYHTNPKTGKAEISQSADVVIYLTLAGLYRTVRNVLDIDGWYYMGTEYLECKFCKRKFAESSSLILDQLDRGRRSFFPALLTYSKKELQLHCKRRTRGTAETSRLIKEVIDIFSSDSGKDTMGISLLHRDSILQIWHEQQRHIECIQDPADTTIQLYTQTGSLVKGGQRLPIYRCARGSTSLESFHLHINRFIPGTTANDMHFQAYLLEGIVRWNEDRAFAALQTSTPRTHSYNSELRHEINRVNKIVYGSTVDETYQDPGRFTDEPEEQADILDDEGFEEQNNEDDPTICSLFDGQQPEQAGTSYKPPHLIQSVVDNIIHLWKRLLAAFQESQVLYPPRYRDDAQHTGRFMQKKTATSHTQTITQGTVSLRRAMVVGNSGPATSVDASPLVEAICLKLESICHSPQKVKGKRTVSRWKVILDKYHHIRNLVTLHARLMATTNLQLYELSQTTLLTWWNSRQKKLEKRVLTQTPPPPAAMEASTPLPPAKTIQYYSFIPSKSSHQGQTFLGKQASLSQLVVRQLLGLITLNYSNSRLYNQDLSHFQYLGPLSSIRGKER
ncbi:hypothetical protein HOLleu_20922 [Holothuria leucospilota]|uniref:DUF6729 domain-containing protein n=1 Tax=Holothuria leucospilota TaxID=206669 RepID=A0A9Q1BVQ4_HOLLE|nr:hypothetical protein HOLleu_20922 [Holothuria leucospilota]